MENTKGILPVAYNITEKDIKDLIRNYRIQSPEDKRSDIQLIPYAVNTLMGCEISFVMEDGRIVTGSDMTRWDNAKRYQKFIGFFSHKYKQKFIDPRPIKCEINNLKQ